MNKLLTLIALLAFSFSYSQTLVNQDWVITGSSPTAMYDSRASHFDAAHNLYVVGNTFHSGQQENMLIQKFNSSGVLQWETEYNGTLSSTDFATDVTTIGSNIFVTGVEGDTTTGKTYITTIELNSSGVIQWTNKYTGTYSGYNIPARIIPNAAGNLLYVCGTSQTSSADFAMVTLCISTAGTQQWAARYDSTGFYSGGADLKIVETNIVTYGVCGLTTSSGNFITKSYNLTNGASTGYTRVNNPNSYITKPIGMVKDNAENIYLTGVVQTSPNNTDIKLIKLDSLMNLKWAKIIDGGANKNDEVAGIKIDNNGYIVLAGFAAAADTSKSVWTIRMKDSVIVWNQKYYCPIAHQDAKGASVDIDSLNNIYVAGKIYDGTNYDDLTLAYDTSGNIKWQKVFASAGSYNKAQNIIVDSGGYVYVNGETSMGATNKYTTIKYEQYTKHDTLAATSGGAQYVANQLIIRFAPSAVNQASVNNTQIDFGAPSYWLTASADSALQSKLGFSLSSCKMERIYKGLKATYKYSTSRNGDKVVIPNLWAAFLLTFPSGNDATRTAAEINGLFPTVTNTGLNYVARFTGTCYNSYPFPASCHINDPYFFPGASSLYTGQQNLWGDTVPASGYYANCDSFYNINIDSAWALETGKPFIKVGIYDTGLDGLNQDFCPVTGGDQHDKANGWDFYNNVSLPSTGWLNADDQTYAHGTWNTGIIGAIRNNGAGIAGIAGGSYRDTTDLGVTLYGMKIFRDTIYGMGSSAAIFTQPISVLCNALSVGCTYTDSGYGFGLHVINNSWGMMTDSTAQATLFQGRAYSDAELSELETAFKYVYRNQTAIVASAGNYLNQTIYPANFYNDWIICVGGADDRGRWYQASQSIPYNQSYAGPCVDLIAPSATESGDEYYITSTAYRGSGLFGHPNYATTTNALGGTSTAAPHATGTIALLMSYLDSTAASYQNLSPEDAEHLLTRSANNMGYIGHSDSTGWGDLNAGRSLQSVNKACNKLVHYGKGNGATSFEFLVKPYTPIKLTEPYTNPITGQTFADTTTYLCWVYKAANVVPQSLGSYSITDYWTRPSSTTLMLAYDSVAHTLSPFEHLYIDSITPSYTGISGYYYVVYRATDSLFLGYWGADSNITINQDSFRFDYTLLLNNPTVSCYPIDTSTHIREVQNSMDVSFYPNPVNDAGILQIFSSDYANVSIDMFDLEGRKMEAIYSGALNSGGNTFNIDTKPLSSGVYMIAISSGEGKKTIKFTKL